MTDQVLLVSRISLLALVYLVFLRVARAVVVEIRAESGAVEPKPERKPMRVPAAVAASDDSNPPVQAVPSGSKHSLVIRSPKSAGGQSFALVGETTIGRASGCAVSIDDARISKIHARLFPDGDRWIVEDLRSTNGTAVNGDRLDMPRVLRPRDLIQVGEIVMEFT